MKVIRLLLALAVVTLMSAACLAAYTYSCFYLVKLDATKRVVVAKGQGSFSISSLLVNNGVIADKYTFAAALVYFAHRNRFIIAGEYEFGAGSNPRLVLDKLLRGERLVRKAVVPEGYTVYQIMRYLEALEGLSGTINKLYPEGFLLPSTYYYYWGNDRQELLDRMYFGMQSFLAHNIISNAAQVITLASIVEKEARFSEERPIIAAVYLNRLKAGMPLQADPTVIYAIYNGKTDFRHNLSKRDLAIVSPYNTYINRGLPPGAIANPGKASILAVIHPAQTPYLYFVADGTGRHKFSVTLDEHNRKVRAIYGIPRGDK